MGLHAEQRKRPRGTVDCSRLAPPDGPVIVGSAAQRDLRDSVDRRLRGGAHGVDHEFPVRPHSLFVADDLAAGGYCHLREDGRVELLAATSRRLATRLPTAALLILPEGARADVRNLMAQQLAGTTWAARPRGRAEDVGPAAGLE